MFKSSLINLLYRVNYLIIMMILIVNHFAVEDELQF